MRNRAVHWSEGMFLRPQHFQSADRHWQELIATSDVFDHAYNYGLVSIEINEKALANSQLEIIGCRARMKDGTIISFSAQHVDRLDLKDGLKGPDEIDQLFLKHEHVTVYLAIPQLVEGRANVAHNGAAENARFVAYPLECDDESAGGNRQEIGFRDVNVRIMLSIEERDGFDCLPICRIRRSTTGEGKPAIDKDYFPPCLAIDAWPDLGINVVRAVFDMISERATVLSRQISERGINMSSQHPGDLEKLFMTHALNQALGTLSCLAFANGVHPFVAYTALCEIIGSLSIFGKNVRAPDFLKYDHDDLAKIFKWAQRQIEALIYALQKDEYVQRVFGGAGRGLQVALEPSWFGHEWEWFIGVDAGQTPPEECFHLLASGKIDWKLGSTDQIDFLFQQRAEGVRLLPVKQVPRALPVRGNWIYFSISRDNDAWKQVQLTNSLGMRVKEEQIHNINNLQGQRKIIIHAEGKLVGLEFAVFAVRMRI